MAKEKSRTCPSSGNQFKIATKHIIILTECSQYNVKLREKITIQTK